MISNAHAEDLDSANGTRLVTGRVPTLPLTQNFLSPLGIFAGVYGPRQKPGSIEDDAVLNAGIFQYSAQRAVWIDFRNGAAVMWSPILF